MQANSTDIWIDACNLCGSVDYEHLYCKEVTLRRCRVCGLAQLDPREGGTPNERLLSSWIFETALRRLATQGGEKASPVNILVIGDVPEERLRIFEREWLSLKRYSGSISSASFVPEEFDMILCARSMESFPSPSDLFLKARIWLKPGGMLVAGGANWEALERRLSTSRWLEYYPGGRYYLGFGHLRQYATRFGFEIASSGTTPSLHIISSVLFGANNMPGQIVAVPLRLAAMLPRLGSTWWGVLVKRSLATRPVLHSPLEEMEVAPGFATAGYGSFSYDPPRPEGKN